MYSLTVQLVPGYTALYVPISLVAAALVLWAARNAGLDVYDLGLGRPQLMAGVNTGAAVAGLAAIGLAMAVAEPMFHPLLEDERVGDIGLGLLAYRFLIRIPFGTVLLEEVAFRGALLGAWLRLAGPVTASVGSSVVFGLWHIRPALELLEANGLAESTTGEVLGVGLAVAFTAAAGGFFCWLRINSHSLLAPIVAHAGINSFALVAAFVVING